MSSSNQARPKRSQGRQKVTMVKMSNESNLQVTFSKRRAGLFKKASELCTLCGCEAAIVVFSPADKVFCFGHPNVQTVIDKFERSNFPPMAQTNNNNNARSQLILEAHRNSTIRELNLELTQVESMLRVEKRRAEELDSLRKSGITHGWYYGSFDGFNFGQLRVLKESIMDFKKNLDVKVQNDMFTLANPLPNFNHPPNPRDFGDHDTFNNNAQMLVGYNDMNPYDIYHGPFGFGENIGLLDGPYKGITNYDEGLNDPMSSNTATRNDYYQQSDSGNITAGFVSSQGFNMSYDPRLF